MSMNDPIADFLTRIRNAIMREQKRVEAPLSGMKKQIACVLETEGFINSWKLTKDGRQHPLIQLNLKYTSAGESVIRGLKRVSKPGLRKYHGAQHMPLVFNGQGIAIVTTSKGLLTDAECRFQKMGGEILCEFW